MKALLTKSVFCFIVNIACVYFTIGQNLISNYSFSEVYTKRDSLRPYVISYKMKSNIKDWYLPQYINYKTDPNSFNGLYSMTTYFTCRDKELMIRNKRYTNAEQLFEGNFGFIRILIDKWNPIAVIQQELPKAISKGRYCFRFKYKFLKYQSETKVKNNALEFCFSDNDLRKFYSKKLNVPKELVQVVFKDTIYSGDENSPWIQACFQLELKGNEKYLTIGSLINSEGLNSWGEYFIDEIELLFLGANDVCKCEKFNIKVEGNYSTNFKINSLVLNDSLIIFTPKNSPFPRLITPQAKSYLLQLVAFLQNNPKSKIKFIEYEQFKSLREPVYYHLFERFLIFYGIDQSRISVKKEPCENKELKYCGLLSEFIRIGYVLSFDYEKY